MRFESPRKSCADFRGLSCFYVPIFSTFYTANAQIHNFEGGSYFNSDFF